MIISYLSHKKIQVQKGRVSYVGTGSQRVYLDFVQGFKTNKSSKISVFTDEYDETTIKKEIDWVGSLIDYDEIPNKLTKKVIETITDTLTNEEINQMQDLHNQMTRFVQQKLFMTDLPLLVNFDYSNGKLFKYSEVKFDSSIFLEPLELLLTYIRIHAECGDKRVVSVINPSHFLSKEDFIKLAQLCQETQMAVLMFDYVSQNEFVKYTDGLCYYIDEDFVDYY